MIEIKKSKESISNCNACGAINFDHELSSSKKVDMLTEILIGRNLTQKISLCNDCLKELSEKLTEHTNMISKSY